MKVCFLLACLLVAVYATDNQHQEVRDWQHFKAHHGKTYTNAAEEQRRMNIFNKNKAFVKAHNQRYADGDVSYFVSLNKFADLTSEEFSAMYNTLKLDLHTKTPNEMARKQDIPEPASIDWRQAGAVTDVKLQGQCASSWAFSATGSIEGQNQIATGNLISLSEQQLVDCSTQNEGCNGGIVTNAFDYICLYGGIESEESYPYTGEVGTCNATEEDIAVKLSGYDMLPAGDEGTLTSYIGLVGPISVAIDASQLSFQLYAGGVYNEPGCSSTDVNLAVLAVGYDTMQGQDYYIVKNSWGTNWGLDGYIYMSRNNDNNCGIATMASCPNLL